MGEREEGEGDPGQLQAKARTRWQFAYIYACMQPRVRAHATLTATQNARITEQCTPVPYPKPANAPACVKISGWADGGACTHQVLQLLHNARVAAHDTWVGGEEAHERAEEAVALQLIGGGSVLAVHFVHPTLEAAQLALHAARTTSACSQSGAPRLVGRSGRGKQLCIDGLASGSGALAVDAHQHACLPV